jgi:hypothetical protein
MIYEARRAGNAATFGVGLLAFGITECLFDGLAAARAQRAEQDAARRRTAAMLGRIRHDIVGTGDLRATMAARWSA